MARRATTGKARPAVPAPAAAANEPAQTPAPLAKPKTAAQPPLTLQGRIEQLEHELADARSRITDLEQRQRHIADRIAWALDSLRDLMDEDD